MTSIPPFRRRAAILLVVTFASGQASAVTPVSYTGTPVSENFNALGTTGTTLDPVPGWDSGQFNPVQANQPGPGNGITTQTDTSLVADDGTVFLANAIASIGNLGSAGTADRALGGMPKSASGDLFHQVAIRNDSGRPITSFVLSYTGEQWANAPSTNPDALTVWFSDNNPASGFVSMGSGFTFTAPKLSSTGTVLDGNVAGNRAVISGTFTPAAPIAPGNTFYLRWYDRNDPEQDHVLAIDDVTVTPTTLIQQVTILSQNFSTDQVNYTLPGNSNPFRFSGTSYWARSDMPGLTVNPGVTGSDGSYLGTQNIDSSLPSGFSSTAPAQVDFTVPASAYFDLKLSIALAGMPAAETSNFLRAKVDTNGDGTYETTLFDFKGNNNSAYTDAVLGTLTAAFKTFSNLALPAPTAADGNLRLRLESYNDTDSQNEATGIDSIVISGTPLVQTNPPTVELTSPADHASFLAPATIQLAATAVDTDGSVSRVVFHQGSTRLGEDTTPPYQFTWSNAPAGDHTLTAMAVDNSGTTGTSAPVVVHVLANQAPTIAPASPADGGSADGALGTVRLSATVADPESQPLAVTFYGRPAAPPVGPDFTLVTLPDTQFYSENLNNRLSQFISQTNWIVSQRVPLNIAFVAHMGDMVNNASVQQEWLNADSAMDIIEDPVTTLLAHGIPWGGAPGNHDGSGTQWNQHFGAARWAGRTYYQGNYNSSNTNNYQFFSASGMDFIVINLAYATTANQAVHDWADALLKAHPSRRAIITSHWLIGTGNPASFGGQGQALYDNLKDNPNLFLMLCGHIHGEGRRQDVHEGRTVYTVLQDYQSNTDGLGGGGGWLRYFEFSPANNTITAKTYRTTTGQYDTDAASQFTLSYNMGPGSAPWVPLGTVNLPAGATTATLDWTGLAAGSRYEWYAAAGDGPNSTGSATRSFTTPARFTNPHAEGFDSLDTNGVLPPGAWTMRVAAAGTVDSSWTALIDPAGVAAMVAAPGPLTATPAPGGTNNNGFNAADSTGNAANRVLATSPVGVAGTAAELALSNGTGTAIDAIRIGYDIHRYAPAATANELPGYQLFLSLDGGATWANAPALNPALAAPAAVMVPNSQGVTSVPPTDVPLGGNWNPDAVLLLRWVDDNAGQSSPDHVIGLDNVSIAAAEADTDGDGMPDQWELANGTHPGTVDVDSDLDADGLPALLEFAFGTNGAAADAGPLEITGGNVLARRGTPFVDLGPVNDPANARVLFCRRTDHVLLGLKYRVEFSSDLDLWQPAVEIPEVMAGDGEIEVVSLPFPDLGGRPARFVRLVVSHP